MNVLNLIQSHQSLIKVSEWKTTTNSSDSLSLNCVFICTKGLMRIKVIYFEKLAQQTAAAPTFLTNISAKSGIINKEYLFSSWALPLFTSVNVNLLTFLHGSFYRLEVIKTQTQRKRNREKKEKKKKEGFSAKKLMDFFFQLWLWIQTHNDSTEKNVHSSDWSWNQSFSV